MKIVFARIRMLANDLSDCLAESIDFFRRGIVGNTDRAGYTPELTGAPVVDGCILQL